MEENNSIPYPSKQVLVVSKDFSVVIVPNQIIKSTIIIGFDIMTEELKEIPLKDCLFINKSSPLIQKVMSHEFRFKMVEFLCDSDIEKAEVMNVGPRTIARYRQDLE